MDEAKYWTEEEIRRIIQEACLSEREELADIILWAQEEMRKQKRKEETWEKIKGTLIGQLALWMLVGVGWAIYTALVAWVARVRGG